MLDTDTGMLQNGFELNGGQGQNRTADTRIFNALDHTQLYCIFIDLQP